LQHCVLPVLGVGADLCLLRRRRALTSHRFRSNSNDGGLHDSEVVVPLVLEDLCKRKSSKRVTLSKTKQPNGTDGHGHGEGKSTQRTCAGYVGGWKSSVDWFAPSWRERLDFSYESRSHCVVWEVTKKD
jgi:hypothetical protein